MMKGRSKYQDEQANRRKYPRNWRHIPKDRAKADKHDGENVKQEAEWCMLCMLVRRFAAHTILLLVDFFSKQLFCGLRQFFPVLSVQPRRYGPQQIQTGFGLSLLDQLIRSNSTNLLQFSNRVDVSLTQPLTAFGAEVWQ
jgi:hypothetical protein